MDASRVYRLDDVEVDTHAGCVRRSGVEEPLRQKSFQVLVFLIQNRGRLVTKDELMNALWPGIVVTEDAIVQSIVEVRRLLRDDAKAPRYVKTIPKQGYRFVGDVEEIEAGSGDSDVFCEEETSVHVEVTEERVTFPVVAFRPDGPWVGASGATAPEVAGAGASRSPRILQAAAVLAIALLGGVGLALGERLLARGEAPARTAAVPLSETSTKSLPAYRAYTRALERAEAFRSSEAVALLEEAIRLDPSFAMAHARLGYVYAFSWGRIAEARPYLEKAWALSDGLSGRDRQTIAAWYAVAHADYEGAIRGYRNLLVASPDDVESLVRLGQLLRGEERHEEAVEVLRRALLRAPDSAEAVNRLSGTLMEMGRHDEAIDMASRYVSLVPGEPNAYDSLGLALSWAGRLEEALEAYGRALELAPDFEIARVHRGNTHVWLGRYREARADYEAYLAHARSPIEVSRAHSSLSFLHLRLGDRESARAEAEAAMATQPGAAGEAFRLALEEGDRARVAALKDLVARPSAEYAERGARASRRPFTVARGQLALFEGRTEEGLETLRTARRQRPVIYYVDPLEDSLAAALLSLGRNAEAADELRRLLSRNPNDAFSRYRLGVVLEALGERRASRAELTSFLELWKGADADGPEVVDARARLGLSASPSTSPSARRSAGGRAP